MARKSETFVTRFTFHSVDLLRASPSRATVCVPFFGKTNVFKCADRRAVGSVFLSTRAFANAKSHAAAPLTPTIRTNAEQTLNNVETTVGIAPGRKSRGQAQHDSMIAASMAEVSPTVYIVAIPFVRAHGVRCHLICGHPLIHTATCGPSVQPRNLLCKSLATCACNKPTSFVYMGFGFDAVAGLLCGTATTRSGQCTCSRSRRTTTTWRSTTLAFRTTDTASRNRARFECKHEVEDFRHPLTKRVVSSSSSTRHLFVNEAQKQEQPLTQSEAEDEFDALIETQTRDQWTMEFTDDAKFLLTLCGGSNRAHRRHALWIGHRARAWRTRSGNAVPGLLFSEIRLVARAGPTTRGPSSDHHRDRVEWVEGRPALEHHPHG